MERLESAPTSKRRPPTRAKKIRACAPTSWRGAARRCRRAPRKSRSTSSRRPVAWTAGTSRFRLGCSSGTYARTLAHETGRRLGCGAHLAALRRHGSARSASRTPCASASSTPGSPRRPIPGPAGFPSTGYRCPFARSPPTRSRRAASPRPDRAGARARRPRRATGSSWSTGASEFIAVGTVVERIGDRGVGRRPAQGRFQMSRLDRRS